MSKAASGQSGRSFPRARLTPNTCQKIVGAHAAGEPVAHIARRLGLSRQTVYEALRRAGVPPRSPRASAGSLPAILSEEELVRRLPDAGVVAIIGPQGSGKTATA